MVDTSASLRQALTRLRKVCDASPSETEKVHAAMAMITEVIRKTVVPSEPDPDLSRAYDKLCDLTDSLGLGARGPRAILLRNHDGAVLSEMIEPCPDEYAAVLYAAFSMIERMPYSSETATERLVEVARRARQLRAVLAVPDVSVAEPQPPAVAHASRDSLEPYRRPPTEPNERSYALVDQAIEDLARSLPHDQQAAPALNPGDQRAQRRNYAAASEPAANPMGAAEQKVEHKIDDGHRRQPDRGRGRGGRHRGSHHGDRGGGRGGHGQGRDLAQGYRPDGSRPWNIDDRSAWSQDHLPDGYRYPRRTPLEKAVDEDRAAIVAEIKRALDKYDHARKPTWTPYRSGNIKGPHERLLRPLGRGVPRVLQVGESPLAHQQRQLGRQGLRIGGAR